MERTPSIAAPTIRRVARSVGLFVATAAVVAACAGGGATTPPVTQAPATQAPATQAPATAAAATQAPAGLVLALATNATGGQYVTGANGLALYVFEKDSAGTSACTGSCADNWPPLVVTMLDDVSAGAGVTGALGTISRDDGSLQVTLAGRPLYYFKGDAAAGDVNGQGINGVWYLAGADGSSLGMAGSAPTTAPAESKCSGPTCY
jgi:predicted lipoprotein with Yx(FWY)xxD motif